MTALVAVVVVQGLLIAYLFVCVVTHNGRLESLERDAHRSHSFGQAIFRRDEEIGT